MLYSQPGQVVTALYHRKTPRHNWLCYSYTSELSHIDRLLSACKRDTAYWQSDTAQIARVDYTIDDTGRLDVPDNVKSLVNPTLYHPGG